MKHPTMSLAASSDCSGGTKGASALNIVRATLIVAAVLILGATPAPAEESVSIKGVLLGDTIDKMGQLTTCIMARGGICMGKAPYGPIPDAGFMVSYVAGKINLISVTFPSTRSNEVLAGPTERFGTPSVPSQCTSECYSWRRGSSQLMLVMDAKGSGGVVLSSASPVGGF
jgi:hypothetical protein